MAQGGSAAPDGAPGMAHPPPQPPWSARPSLMPRPSAHAPRPAASFGLFGLAICNALHMVSVTRAALRARDECMRACGTDPEQTWHNLAGPACASRAASWPQLHF